MLRVKNSHITYHDFEQGSPEWLEARNTNKFTGSNASKLLTSFGGGSWAMAKDSKFTGNFHTERGHLLEVQGIELYEKIKNKKVSHTGFVTNEKYPNCLYSPDGFLPDRTIEVKCFSVKRHLETIESQDVNTLAQIHFGQLIMEKPATDLILYNPSQEVPVEKKLVIIEIKKDLDIQRNFKRIIKEYNERQEKSE